MQLVTTDCRGVYTERLWTMITMENVLSVVLFLVCAVQVHVTVDCKATRDVSTTDSEHNVTTVGVILLVSSSSDFDSTGSIEIVHDAIHSITDTELLQDVSLEVAGVVESHQCGISSTTLYSIFHTMSVSTVPVIGLLNGGCPAMSAPLEDIERLINISTVSFSPGLSISANYRNSVALFPHPQTTISILASLIQFNGWKRMSVITSDNGIISKNHKLLVRELETKGVKLFDTMFILPDSNFTSIQNLSSRIVFLDVDKNDAKKILCEAYKHNLLYPFYEWILHGWYDPDWIIDNTTLVSCTHLELLKVVNRALVIQDYPINNDVKVHFKNCTTEPKCIPNNCGPSLIDSELTFVSSLAQDAISTFILALNQSLSNDIFKNGCLLNRDNCLLPEPLADASFSGKSGPVEFDEDGNRVFQSSNILQYREDGDCVYLVPFAQAVKSINGTYSITLLVNESTATIWPDGLPYDGSPLEKLVAISLTAVIPIYVVTTIGIVFALICLTFTFVFRNRKIIRLTSPNLNYCIDIGAIFIYISLYIRMLPVFNLIVWKPMCHALVWTNIVGFILCFGPVFAKVWRIYYIFKNPTSKKKHIKDVYLLLMVLVMLGVALALLIFGTFTPGLRPEAYIGPSLDNPFSVNEYGITVNHNAVNCFTLLSFSWAIFLSVCVIIIEIGAVILALKTRNIKIKPLNDYKEITVIAYVTTVGTIEAFIIAAVLSGHDTLTESLLSAAFFIITTTILGLTHIPKMRSLYMDPKGEKVFDDAFAIDSGGGNKIMSGRNSMGSHPALNKTSSMDRRVSTEVNQHVQNGTTQRHQEGSRSSIASSTNK